MIIVSIILKLNIFNNSVSFIKIFQQKIIVNRYFDEKRSKSSNYFKQKNI